MIGSDYFEGIQGLFCWENIISLIAYFISIVGIFIFLELIIIGFYNIDRNTTLHISNRSILENKEIQFQNLMKVEEISENSIIEYNNNNHTIFAY